MHREMKEDDLVLMHVVTYTKFNKPFSTRRTLTGCMKDYPMAPTNWKR